MKSTFLTLLLYSLPFVQFAQDAIPDWFLEDMEKEIGTWVADNSAYQSEQEPYDAYHIDWQWSIPNYCIKGQLYGVVNGDKSPVFWEFRKFWDGQQQKPKVIQLGLDGTLGIGHEEKMHGDTTKLSQIFTTSLGTEREEGHKTVHYSDSVQTGSSFHITDEGAWEKKRTYTWKKQTMSDAK